MTQTWTWYLIGYMMRQSCGGSGQCGWNKQRVSRLRNRSLVVAGHRTSIYALYFVAVYPWNTVFCTKYVAKMDILDIWEQEKTAETSRRFFWWVANNLYALVCGLVSLFCFVFIVTAQCGFSFKWLAWAESEESKHYGMTRQLKWGVI